MPEGHLYHRLARNLNEFTGCELAACSPQGRFTEGAAQINGSRLEVAEAHGKHLLVRFVGGWTVHVHLGMRGKLLRFPDVSRPPLPQVQLRLAGATAAWDLIALATCELLDDPGVAGLLARLGPDPLREDADPERAWTSLQAAPGALGAALLDQSVIAGIGNVFRAEALFACGQHPSRPAASLTRAEFDRLWATVRAMMGRAVEDGRIVTVDPPAGRSRTEIPGIADVSLDHGRVDADRTSGEAGLTLRLADHRPVSSVTTSGPSRRTSLRTVDSSGTR